MAKFTIRCEGGEFLTINVLGRLCYPAADYWDGNWLTATVEFQAGGFGGSIGGYIRSEELFAFHDQLVRLQGSLRGTAEFATMEGWLSIRVEGDGRGRMQCRCVVRDEPGVGNTLDCILATDQTFTRSTIEDLAAAVQAFPVVGGP